MGGGGFFDVQWNYSQTGVTMNFVDEFIDAIRTKVIVNAMGYHEYPGITNSLICEKFNSFLSKILSKKNWLISVRNDGSYQRIQQRYGVNRYEKILRVADNAFFCDFPDLKSYSDHDNKKTIGMCITNDLFSPEFNGDLNEKIFNNYMSKVINQLCELGYNIMLIPHIPSDIDIICHILNNVENEYKRNNLLIGSLDCCGYDTVCRMGRNYRVCDLIVGMRFHSLITGINCRIPTIALAGHAQIVGLFEELGLDKYIIKVDNIYFTKKLIEMIDYSLSNSEKIKKVYKAIYIQLEENRIMYRNEIMKFLNNWKMEEK